MRKSVDVECKTCGAQWMKRKDSLGKWGGQCRSCAMKAQSQIPHVHEAKRKNGIEVMRRVGQLPHYPERYRRGPENNRWRGGVTPENQRVRHSLEMKAWRKAVFERDDHTCQICQKRGGDKHADHIKPFALHPELRFDVSNGRTLCVPCHRTHGAKVSAGKLIRPPSATNWLIG